MRIFSLIIMSTAVVTAADWKIDHATVAGTNLEAMRKAFTAVTKIPTQYGGPHSNHATEMALVSFPDGSYLEFMGIQAEADQGAVAAHTWVRSLRNNGGPCAFALRVPDVSAEVARLKSAGIEVGVAERNGRTRPDGTVLKWETADVGSGPRGSIFPFLIRDLTPRENRVYPTGVPTTDRFGGIAKVVIGVGDLDATIAQYRRAFRLAEPLRQSDERFGADLAWFEGTPVVLARARESGAWLTRRVREYGNAPCAFLLTTGSRGIIGGLPSRWFGHSVFWEPESMLGWRLGIEASR